MHYQRKQVSACNAPSTASTVIKTTTASPARPIHSISVEYALVAPQAVMHAQMCQVAASAAVATSWLRLYVVLALKDAVPALLAPAMSAQAA